jgi:hypothetical protein
MEDIFSFLLVFDVCLFLEVFFVLEVSLPVAVMDLMGQMGLHLMDLQGQKGLLPHLVCLHLMDLQEQMGLRLHLVCQHLMALPLMGLHLMVLHRMCFPAAYLTNTLVTEI